MATVAERVIRIIAEQAGRAPEEVTADLGLADLGVDSLGLVEAIFAIEEEFDIELLDDQIELMKTPADIVRIVDNIEEEAEK